MENEIKYEPVIGLEVHVQLGTRTKMFCSCPVPEADSSPNTCVCPVCTGQPGALPVTNAAALELAVRAALVLKCKVRGRSIFARKNYFYPDLPKNYQISQFEEPLSEHGKLQIELEGGVKKIIGITRGHVEEDAGKLLHAIGAEELSYSLVDFNRCGVPLLEIVSEPDMRSPEEAHAYLTALKSVLQWSSVSDCDMEKGELRCDVNVSLRPEGRAAFGTKVELKNLNSFKAVKDSLYYEIRRQEKALRDGEKIVQETRLWDEKEGVTLSMRSKEEAHDYRYFPDPDLVPLVLDGRFMDKATSGIPAELPAERKARFMKEFKLSDYDAGVLTSERVLSEYFEKCVKSAPVTPKAAANWITTELLARLKAARLEMSRCPVDALNLSGLVRLVESGKISGKIGKEVFDQMWKTGKSAAEIVEASGMSQVNDREQIAKWAAEAIAENPKAVEDFKKGKETAIGSLVGLIMKKSRGKANPALCNSLLRELLSRP